MKDEVIRQGYTLYPNYLLNKWREEMKPGWFNIILFLWQDANHDGRRIKGETVHEDFSWQRGQTYRSVREIASKVGVDKNLVHRALKSKIFRQYLRHELRQGKTLITFYNYANYSNINCFKGTPLGTGPGTKARQNRYHKKSSLTEKTINKNSFSAENGKKNSSRDSLSEDVYPQILHATLKKIRGSGKLSSEEKDALNFYIYQREKLPASARRIVIEELESLLEDRGFKGFDEAVNGD